MKQTIEIPEGHKLVEISEGCWKIQKEENLIDWIPKKLDKYYWLDSDLKVESYLFEGDIDFKHRDSHNTYQTKKLAKNAAELTRVQWAITRACLLVDPERGGRLIQTKDNWRPEHMNSGWMSKNYSGLSEGGAVVSTEEKCEQVIEYLNKHNIKPVGVL